MSFLNVQKFHNLVSQNYRVIHIGKEHLVYTPTQNMVATEFWSHYSSVSWFFGPLNDFWIFCTWKLVSVVCSLFLLPLILTMMIFAVWWCCCFCLLLAVVLWWFLFVCLFHTAPLWVQNVNHNFSFCLLIYVILRHFELVSPPNCHFIITYSIHKEKSNYQNCNGNLWATILYTVLQIGEK